MTSVVLHSARTSPQCEPPAIRVPIRPSPCLTATCLAHQPRRQHCPHARCFSTTPQLGYRKKQGSRDYPGFRNETKDQRLVREHKLFNPFSSLDDNPLAQLVRPVRSKRRTTLPVSETSSAELESELLFLAIRSPPGARVLNLLDHLIHDRREKPNVLHYEALIHANASAGRGSAENVRHLLQEMEEHKIHMNVNTYTAVLRTLVVHPDVQLLEQVIDSCERMWIPLDSEMLHFISAAYLRADMPELATEYLDLIDNNASSVVNSDSTPTTGVANSSGRVELWLYVLFLQNLALREDWEGVLRMCYRLDDDESLGISLAMRQVDIPRSFWHWLLVHVSSRHRHWKRSQRWPALWIWDLWVRRAWIQPSVPTCMKVLTICARNGLYQSSEGVLQVLHSLKARDNQQDKLCFDTGEEVDKAELERLLNLSYENAGPDVPRMTESEKQKLNPHWTMFDDTMGIEKKIGTEMRLDPWAGLPTEHDSGRAWPRVVWERDAEQNMRQDTDQNRKAAIRGKHPGEVMVAVRAWPEQLQDDIEALASLRFNHKETRKDEIQAIETSEIIAPFTAIDTNEPETERASSVDAVNTLSFSPAAQATAGEESQANVALDPMIPFATDSGSIENDGSIDLESVRGLSNNPVSEVSLESITASWKPLPTEPATSALNTDRAGKVLPLASYDEGADNQPVQDPKSSTPGPQARRTKGEGTSMKPGPMTSDEFFASFEEGDERSRKKKW